MFRELNLDLDGVFVDFYPAAAKLIGRPYAEVRGAHAWGVIDQVPNFFRGINPMPDALELWAGIQDFIAAEGDVTTRVLSAVPKLTNRLVTAPADKRDWVRRHLCPTIPVCLVDGGPAKVLFAKPGALLIDDLERNIRLWEAAGGIGILHTNARDTLRQLQAHSRLNSNSTSR